MIPLLVHRLAPSKVITADCGALIGDVAYGHQHTAHSSLTASDRRRYESGSVAGRRIDVCSACWPQSTDSSDR